jgi:hypothetical protein
VTSDTRTRPKARLTKNQEFILRVKRKGELEHFVARRYGDFVQLHRHIRTELPGKVLQPVPRKNKSNSTATGLFGSGGNDSEVSSISSSSTQQIGAANGSTEGFQKMLTVKG